MARWWFVHLAVQIAWGFLQNPDSILGVFSDSHLSFKLNQIEPYQISLKPPHTHHTTLFSSVERKIKIATNLRTTTKTSEFYLY